MPSRRKRSQHNPLLGLWIALGILGAIFVIVSIAILVSLDSNKPDTTNSSADTSIASPLVGGGISVDDGSPVQISQPQFLKNRHGQIILRVNYHIKDFQQLPANDRLTMWLRCGKRGSYSEYFEAPRMISRSELNQTGTLDLQLFNFLKLQGAYGVRFPPGELSWESRGNRLSNSLGIRLPTDPSSVPLAPELAQLQQSMSRFRVQLQNAQYEGGAIPKLFVDLVPTSTAPDANFQYALVCKHKVAVGGFSNDQLLAPSLLASGGRIEVQAPVGFHSNANYQLQVEAYLPDRRDAATLVSNTMTIPGPRR